MNNNQPGLTGEVNYHEESGEEYPSLNVLIFILAPRNLYRPVIFSRREIFCSPACETEVEGQLFRTIQTPGGVFDIAPFIRQLPSSQQPDLLVVKADATGQSFPVNLKILDCPKLLILGDTHHLSAPIQTLLDYVSQEKFDFMMAEHDRHHLHYFKEAGFEKVFWMPGFNINPHPQTPCLTPQYPLTFVGQSGRFHPYRKYILSDLKKSKLPLNHLQATPEQAAKLYAESLINLNISLNGDLNLRVFEVLASGGFLLTDRLSQQSGLELLFQRDEHLAVFNNESEVQSQINFFLKNPERAKQIARNGHEEFWRNHRPALKVKQVLDYISGQGIDPIYELGLDKRSIYITSQNLSEQRHRIGIYEYLQDLQLNQPHVRSLFGSQVDPRIICDAVDLPRLEIYLMWDAEATDLEVNPLIFQCKISEQITFISPQQLAKNPEKWDALLLTMAELQALGIDTLLSTVNFKRLIVVDRVGNLSAENQQQLDRLLERRGFVKDSSHPLAYSWVKKSEWGNFLISQQKFFEAAKALDWVLQDNPADVTALLELGLLSAELNDLTQAEQLFRKAVSLDRRHPMALENLARVLITLKQYEAAASILEHLLVINSQNPSLWLLLEKCYRSTGEEEKALTVYRHSRELRESRIFVNSPNPLLIKSTAKTPLKRILVINNLYPPQELGGYGRNICDFANLLKERGHTVKVLTSNAPYLGQLVNAEPEIERNLLLFGTFEKETKLLDDPAEINRILRHNEQVICHAIERFQPDVCLVGNINFLGSVVFNPLLAKFIPVINHLGLPTLLCLPEEMPHHSLYLLATASEYVKQKVLEQGYQSDLTAVIYPGVWGERFKMCMLPDRQKLRIVYAGLFIASKGTHTLIEALKILHDRNVDFECSLAGDGFNEEYVNFLKEFVINQGMSDRVKFLNYLQREELIELYSTHNVIVFPSIGPEAFGISPVEGMAAGLTAISTGVGGAREVLEDGVSGLLFPAENAVALADTLMSLLADRERWACIAARGEKRARDYFDIERSVDILEEKFEWLWQGRNSNEEYLQKKVRPSLQETLRLREINLVVFPDWEQPEEILASALKKLLIATVNHPNNDQIMLLIDSSGFSEEEASLVLSSVAMNLLMQEDLELANVAAEFSIIGELTAVQWQALLPCIQARIGLEHENQAAIAQAKATSLPVWELDNFSSEPLLPLRRSQPAPNHAEPPQREPSDWVANYWQYLQYHCPDSNPDSLLHIKASLDSTSWEEPASAIDLNNYAVLTLIEAEKCQDVWMREMYVEMAVEALRKGLELYGHPLCAAHLALIFTTIGDNQQSLQMAWHNLIIPLQAVYNNAPKIPPGIIYFPPSQSSLKKLELEDRKQIVQSDNGYQQALLLLTEGLCRSQLFFYSKVGLPLLQLATQICPHSVALKLKLLISRFLQKQVEGIDYLLKLTRQQAAGEVSLLHALSLGYQDLGQSEDAFSCLAEARQLCQQSPDSLDCQWTKLEVDRPFTYVNFADEALLAVEPSFRSIVTSVLSAEGDWFENEMEFWRNSIELGMTVIDVGANVGVYTFSAAQKVGETGRVLAIEPFSYCVRCLQESCRINEMDWVTVLAGAASDRQGKARLFLYTASESNELVPEEMAQTMQPGSFEEVSCFTLDSLIEQENIKQVDFLKIDAEGHELAVLTGSDRILTEFHPVILYENIAGSKGGNPTVANYLVNKGYTLFRYKPYINYLIPVNFSADLQHCLNFVAIPESKLSQFNLGKQ